MIVALLCACQLVSTVSQLVVDTGAQPTTIQAHSRNGVPHVSLSAVVAAAGGQLRILPNGRTVLEMAGAQLELIHGVPYARAGGVVIPLASAPVLMGDNQSIPLQLLSQVLPGATSVARYDRRSRTLLLGSAVAQAEAAKSARPEVKSAGGAPAKAAIATPTKVATVTPTKAATVTPTKAATVTPTKAATSAATPAEPPVRRKIVLDAGHGGPDEGTSVVLSNGTRVAEKSITLSVANLLGIELGKRNFDVVHTRKRDTLIALRDRGAIANDKEGSAFISVHVNAVSGGSAAKAARGVETYFLSVASTEDAKRVAALENSAVRFESAPAQKVERDPLSFILNDMQQNNHLRESSDLATRIQGSLSRVHPGGSRGVKQAEFAVLVGAFMPAVLVEVGFLSNSADAAFLIKKENQQKIAVSIADAIQAHFRNVDARTLTVGTGR